jgi:hypothetical protein
VAFLASLATLEKLTSAACSPRRNVAISRSIRWAVSLDVEPAGGPVALHGLNLTRETKSGHSLSFYINSTKILAFQVSRATACAATSFVLHFDKMHVVFSLISVLAVPAMRCTGELPYYSTIQHAFCLYFSDPLCRRGFTQNCHSCRLTLPLRVPEELAGSSSRSCVPTGMDRDLPQHPQAHRCLNGGGTTPRRAPMAKVLLSAYAGVAVYFLRAYLRRPSVAGVAASLLWPLALALAWLIMVDDDDLPRQAIVDTAAAPPGQPIATGRGPLVTLDHTRPG